jgi:hypothetical protein
MLIKTLMIILLCITAVLTYSTKPPSFPSLLNLMFLGGTITLAVLYYGFNLNLVPIPPTQ